MKRSPTATWPACSPPAGPGTSPSWSGRLRRWASGTNVQDRAVALHHLDAPWRPADVDQRDGRIIRQGNLNDEVQVIRWVTARSFDGYMWQTLERKARFIHEVMSPTLDAREIADVGDTVLSFSEAKALATGNPLLMDKAEADAALARLAARRPRARPQPGRPATHHHPPGRTRRPTSDGSAPRSTRPSPGGRTPAATSSP